MISFSWQLESDLVFAIKNLDRDTPGIKAMSNFLSLSIFLHFIMRKYYFYNQKLSENLKPMLQLFNAWKSLAIKTSQYGKFWDFHGGIVDGNPPTRRGDVGSIPVWEDSTGCEQLSLCASTTEPICCNYWAHASRAHGLQQKPPQWEAPLQLRVAPAHPNLEKSPQQSKTQCNKNNKKKCCGIFNSVVHFGW